jgi:ribonuclease Z
MRPLLHANLVNGRYGDPALYVEMLFEKRALMFDLGDITFLPPRKIHRIDHVFVSHAHVDHFIGFDVLLRVLVGREKTVHLFGPSGFIERVAHKLNSYEWNLADLFQSDLGFAVTEIDNTGVVRAARFRLKNAFIREPLGARHMPAPIVYSEPTFLVSATVLEHRTPCLAFVLQERAHVNVWRNRLAERGLPVGPWLRELKRAVIEGRPDDHMIKVSQSELGPAGAISLRVLRDVVTVTPGQKIGYVTDAADTPANRQAIIDLVRGAALLFIEAAFAEADAGIAADRAHLTTRAAGEIARASEVRRVEPFHFSPRYQGEEEKMVAEVMAAFQGPLPPGRVSKA